MRRPSARADARLRRAVVKGSGSCMFVAELLEAGMLVCFGLSWPLNAWKSYKAATAQGSSWQFLALICAGYACGVAAKLVLGTLNWVLAVYLLNCLFLAANWAVYFRNRKLDAKRGSLAQQCAVLAAEHPSGAAR